MSIQIDFDFHTTYLLQPNNHNTTRVPYQLSNAYHYRTAVLASLSVVLGVLYMVRKANLYRTQRTRYGPLKSISCDVRTICIYPVHASMIEQEVILSNADACSMTKGLSPTCVANMCHLHRKPKASAIRTAGPDLNSCF